MRKRKKLREEPREHITRDKIFALLKVGVVLAVAFTAPNALAVFAPFVRGHKEWEPYYPSSITRHTMKLWRRGYVEVKETKDGTIVVLSEKGKREVLKYDLENLVIQKQVPWDGKWRMVFFDVPTSHSARNAFREYLKSMGFFQMQKSVYVHPYPCAREVKYVREVLVLPHEVKLATVSALENDNDLRRFFRLG